MLRYRATVFSSILDPDVYQKYAATRSILKNFFSPHQVVHERAFKWLKVEIEPIAVYLMQKYIRFY